MLSKLQKRAFSFAEVVYYLALFLKHLRLMVLLLCLSLVGGLFYYVYARPIYSSKSLVRYLSLARPLDAENVLMEQTDRVLLTRLTSPKIMQRTARRLGLPEDPKALYAEHLVRILPRFDSDRNVEVTVIAYSKQVVNAWVPVMVEEFLKELEEKRAEMRNRILAAYNAEMKDMGEEIESILNAKYQVEGGRKMEIAVKMDELKQLPRKIAIISSRLSQLDRIQSTLESTNLSLVDKLSLLQVLQRESQLQPGEVINAGTGEEIAGENPKTALVVLPTMLPQGNTPPWEQLQRDREQCKTALDEAAKKYLPAHPKMAELLRKMDQINKSIEAELAGAQKQYALEQASLREKKAELMAKLPEFEKVLRDSERLRHDVQYQEVGKGVFSRAYGELARRLSMVDYGAERERIHLQFLGHLELRDQVPVSPNRMKLLVYSLGLGLLLAFGAPFLLEFLDHTVTSVEQIEQHHRLRGLGVVPLVAQSQGARSPSIDLKGNPDRQLTENFRVIRTNLLSMGAVTRNPQALVVASAMPEEGKTMVSFNLAQSFAQMGEKTLLIDADLRRGRLHRVFNQRSAPGLSNILMQGLDWREVVRTTDKENLLLLTCGKHLDGATELVGSPIFEKILQEFRQEFKRIVIDTPPVLGLSETAMMQKHVDGVVLVVWCGRTPANYVKSAVETLQANHANLYGFVLNRLDLSVTSNYYNYYNYYYYSYHYYKSYKALENQPPAPVQG